MLFVYGSKVYKNGQLIGFKEKIDLPDLSKEARETAEKTIFPPMPEDRILRALQHSWDEIDSRIGELTTSSDATVEAMWKNKAITMPIIAKHISTEAREHSFNPPRNLFEIYLNTPIEKIREHPDFGKETEPL